MMAGVDMLHVPFKGTPAAQAAMFAGDAHVMFDPIPSSIELIKAGRLRVLAVTAAKRVDALPDTPAMNELIPGFEAMGWQGIGVPRATPPEIVERLAREINAALADPGMQQRILGLGATVFVSTPAEFARLIESNTEKWAKVIRSSSQNCRQTNVWSYFTFSQTSVFTLILPSPRSDIPGS